MDKQLKSVDYLSVAAIYFKLNKDMFEAEFIHRIQVCVEIFTIFTFLLIINIKHRNLIAQLEDTAQGRRKQKFT